MSWVGLIIPCSVKGYGKKSAFFCFIDFFFFQPRQRLHGEENSYKQNQINCFLPVLRLRLFLLNNFLFRCKIRSVSRRRGDCFGSQNLGSSSLGSGSWPGHCVVPSYERCSSYITSRHPGAWTGTGEFNAGGDPAMDQPPIYGGVTLSRLIPFISQKPKMSTGLMGHLARCRLYLLPFQGRK